MFTINFVSATENRVVKEEHTLEDAERYCKEWEEGRERTTDDGDNWCRLVVCEVLDNRDKVAAFVTDYYEA